MSMSDWAKREVEIACKKENPNWDGKSFDYGCSCYKSALKAYESLMEDGHSGYSFSVTRRILDRLMQGLPLTAITEDDFDPKNFENYKNEEETELPNSDGSVSIQCPRMYSLFKYIEKDGSIRYHDVDRAYSVNIEDEDDTYSGSSSNIVDELFPISLPYYPPKGKYKIYELTFATDECKEDFDTRGIEYLITPDGERVDIKRYYGENKETRKMEEITEEEYKERLSRRRDTLDKIVADRLLFTVVSNSESDKEIERREEIYYKNTPKDVIDNIHEELVKECKVFIEHPEFNGFDTRQNLAKGKCKIPELQHLQDFIQNRIITSLFGIL